MQSSRKSRCASAVLYEDDLLQALFQGGLRGLEQKFSSLVIEFGRNDNGETAAGDGAKFLVEVILKIRCFDCRYLPRPGRRFRRAAEWLFHQLSGKHPDPGVHAGWMLLQNALRRSEEHT